MKRRPRVVLLRGHHANVGELRAWELLSDRYDVTALVTGTTHAGLAGLRVPTKRVRSRRDVLGRMPLADVAVTLPGDAYLGLEERLAGADVVHSAELGPWFSRQPALLKERLGFRLVLTVWETIPFRSTYRTFRARAYRAQTIPHVDLFLAMTERARDGLVLEDVPADRIAVAPPGIDVERFGAPPRERPHEHVLLSPGRLVWEKGHRDAIRAVAAIARGLVVAAAVPRLLIVGAGPERARLARYATDLGVGDRVELRPHVPYDAMPDVYAQASCVVLASLATPTWEEQFGMVLAEALAAGVPIVASTSGAIPEVLDGNGTLVAAGDWLGLARALAAGPLAREPGARAAHDPALVERYSLAAAADRLAAAYERVLVDSGA